MEPRLLGRLMREEEEEELVVVVLVVDVRGVLLLMRLVRVLSMGSPPPAASLSKR